MINSKQYVVHILYTQRTYTNFYHACMRTFMYEMASVTNSQHYCIINFNSGIRVFLFDDARFSAKKEKHWRASASEMDHLKVKKKLYAKL